MQLLGEQKLISRLNPHHCISSQAAAMPRKKTKSKKHKKERKKHRSSTSSSEDQGKEDRERHRGSRRDKKHVSSKSTDSPRSLSETGAKSGMYKKSDGERLKAKSEVNKDSHGREHRALHSSVKHSSSRHTTSTSTKSSSSQIPEAATKEQHEWGKNLGKRRSSSEEPGKRAAEAEEKRKKLMKRRTSKEDDYPVPKRRSNKEQADVDRRERKELVEREYRKSNEERISEWKHSRHEKSQSQHSSKESKHRAPAVTQNVRLKVQGKGHSESIYPPTSREEPSSSAPSLPITFKIPKKSSVVKAQTNTACWETVKKSPITSKCSPKTTDSPSMKVIPEQTRPRTTEVPSPVPSCSPPVQLVQSSRTNETSTSSSSNALVEHASFCDVSTDCTETTDDDYEMQIVEELHLARSSRQLHVNVEKSYGELTSMDVDPADESATIALSQKQQQDLLVVLDTNVLLSHLDFVKRIRSHGLGALGFPTLLVPWVVLQELDSLKSGKLSKNVESKARPAVDYIYTSLKNQEPRLWGQSMQQMSQAACGLNSVNNDDRVLQCCLQYKALYPEGTIMLCTNDKNLCSKALLSGVKALSKADLQEQAEVTPEHFHQRYGQTAAYPHEAPVKQHQEEKAHRLHEEVETSRKKETERELSECVSLLESSLQSALSAILEEEMKAAFGELWLEIVYMKPPWSLDALLQCFRKHWIAVFGVIIRRSLISCVETLSSFVRTDVSVEHSSVLNAVSVAEELLTALRCRSPYSGHVDSALSCLKTLQHRLQAKPQKSPVDDRGGDTLMADAVQDVAPPPQASHQEVWALFESIWNNVCHVSSAVFSALHFSPASMQSVEQQSTPPPQDALSCLHRLNAALEQLLEAFQRLLSVGSTVEDAQALLTFIHASEITTMKPRFTAKDLFECLSHQEYREKLCIGGAQLMELRENLHRCAAAVCGTNT
ncbi:transcriptional protein SWT1 isoform X1 [Pangasianodon hypophthalmus]|uniref:transcriptional protein SWT1 isoform X1 n=1 Tax=Pangasianodon hypophthalmus TaxID=310915 RepID=UPI0023073B6F|nr:transcriptional protein SWT1 isoform X1 [Pangasianodon hypophthalmus]